MFPDVSDDIIIESVNNIFRIFIRKNSHNNIWYLNINVKRGKIMINDYYTFTLILFKRIKHSGLINFKKSGF